MLLKKDIDNIEVEIIKRMRGGLSMPKFAEISKFIGRNNEITELARYLESAVSGDGQIVFINGEAGIGKTRFINEVRAFHKRVLTRIYHL